MVSFPLSVLVAPLYLVSSADLFRVSEPETQRSSDISWRTLSWKDFYPEDLFQCIFTEKQIFLKITNKNPVRGKRGN